MMNMCCIKKINSKSKCSATVKCSGSNDNLEFTPNVIKQEIKIPLMCG